MDHELYRRLFEKRVASLERLTNLSEGGLSFARRMEALEKMVKVQGETIAALAETAKGLTETVDAMPRVIKALTLGDFGQKGDRT